jgi:signal transduction histidine kinase
MQRRVNEVALPADGRLDADPARLAQILGNLLANAAKYTPLKARFTSAKAEGPNAVIQVRDTARHPGGSAAPHLRLVRAG